MAVAEGRQMGHIQMEHIKHNEEGQNNGERINPFQPSVAFHIETNHLIFNAWKMTGLYMKRNTGLNRVKTMIIAVLLLQGVTFKHIKGVNILLQLFEIYLSFGKLWYCQ